MILLALTRWSGFAQEPPSHATEAEPARSAIGPKTELLIGIEIRRDRFSYHFENPSAFDTSVLVPHFFEQRYKADNAWAVGRLRYTAGLRWETALGATLSRASTGDDDDTFFDPDGTVWVSGTTGGLSIHSFEVSQRAEVGRLDALHFAVGYRLRLDHSTFHVGHKTVTQNGMLVAATDVSSPETTTSQMHEVTFGLNAARMLGGAWRVAGDGELAPTTIGRLAVRLPEKYPGMDLVFVAHAFSASADVRLTRLGRWPVELGLKADQTWSYGSTNRLTRQVFGLHVSVGHVWE
jgi:hypothetical protein